MNTRVGIPLRPDVRSRPSDALVRAILATARNVLAGDQRGAARAAQETWPDDQAVQLVLRGASAPAMTGVAGWARELAASSVADLIVGMGPTSAAAELFRRSISLTFGSSNSITVPGIVASASDIGFVEEGAPIPAQQMLVTGPTLTACKMAIVVVLTGELFRHSTPNAELLLRAALTESLAAALDAHLLDANPATAVRPAGLRNGVAALTATAGGGEQAMASDLAALVGAIAPVAGSAVAPVASPDTYTKIVLRAAAPLPFPILATSGLPAKTVLAVALNALVVAVDPEPRFRVSRQAEMHMDTAPAAIGTPGSPATVAAPVRSLFQTDAIGLRLILEISWGLRAPGVAWTQNVTW